MSVKISTTIALSAALTVGATLLTGVTAHAQQRPTAQHAAAAVAPSAKTSTRIGAGSTAPGQGWVAYGGYGIYLDVDTSSAYFTGTPVYTSSVGGDGGQWALTGTSAIYSPTAKGFRIYVRWSSGAALTPAIAQAYKWHVNWIGIDNP
jgi:hypothetical protein